MMLQKKDIELKLQCVLERALMKQTAKMGLFQNQPKFHKFCSFERIVCRVSYRNKQQKDINKINNVNSSMLQLHHR